MAKLTKVCLPLKVQKIFFIKQTYACPFPKMHKNVFQFCLGLCPACKIGNSLLPQQNAQRDFARCFIGAPKSACHFWGKGATKHQGDASWHFVTRTSSMCRLRRGLRGKRILAVKKHSKLLCFCVRVKKF